MAVGDVQEHKGGVRRGRVALFVAQAGDLASDHRPVADVVVDQTAREDVGGVLRVLVEEQFAHMGSAETLAIHGE